MMMAMRHAMACDHLLAASRVLQLHERPLCGLGALRRLLQRCLCAAQLLLQALEALLGGCRCTHCVLGLRL